MFVSLPVSAVDPKVFCDPALLEELSGIEKENLAEACAFAGDYDQSALPDRNATFSGKFREGKTNTYDYKEFFRSLTKSLGRVNKAEKCDDVVTKKAERVAYPSLNLENTAAGTIPVSVVKEDELNRIFAEIAKDKKYAFDIPEGGCWARAHIMARELEKRGIRVGKMFAEGELYVETKKALDGKGVLWSYHVAPIVAVETKKGVELRILDPSLFGNPVPVKTWTDKMMRTKTLKDQAQVYVTDRFVLDPLRGRELSAIHDDEARGRWHVMETVMAEQELELRRNEAEDRKFWRESQNNRSQKKGKVK